ncbi:hypothetical protein [Ottowia sp. VDI28]|uniref:hypothetical protein n=1 Tax=Ottowia sp. VDI28 TaxID=3133968 RepID=UPI003C2EA1ED
MPFRQLPPPYARGSSGTLERIVARVIGVAIWAMLALMGLVFAISLFIWLVVAVVASLFTGRPATVTLLWRRYRDMTRQRWPGRQQAASNTPRADAASATGESAPVPVQDVSWRDIP